MNSFSCSQFSSAGFTHTEIIRPKFNQSTETTPGTMTSSASCLLLAIAVLNPMTTEPTDAQSVFTPPKEEPCIPCDIYAIPEEVRIHRVLYGCTECGYMFNTRIEHCCVCYEDVFKQCLSALKK
ncbi:unnamed protein product [Candidula unifasciata]|uniref:Uncharacterized protein n=1 Tax=Candidula unifasciata TaxID=100452 RepID=A0A8S4ABT7_9EUPU|nr:unnamed protein product [Candidula unifasciata]